MSTAQLPTGLTSEEVATRVAHGDVNIDIGVKTRTFSEICRENICTLFNAINVILALCVFITGSYKNMLFIAIIVINVCIGIVQEVRSKAITDKLSIVASAKATVVRDGQKSEVALTDLVRDDVIELGRGDQVPADSSVLSGECKANESLLTGESKLIKKVAGDSLMSGSFVNEGGVFARVEHVGAENYAEKISAEAKQHKAVNSEIMTTLNRIIKYVSFIIFPLGVLLFCREHFLSHTDANEAILSTVSALVGMIPEGLILLTSTVLAVAVVRLAQSQVLVQQLYCIETLARVDTLCLDKTGTITTGRMEVSSVVPISNADPKEVDTAFYSIAHADENPNETASAILDYYADKSVSPLESVRMIAFSSDKKWSGAIFTGDKAYVMGAGQFVMGEAFSQIEQEVESLASQARVLLLAKVEGFDEEGNMQGTPLPLGLVSIHDQIRSTAAETIGYFKDQGVDLKVISGDDPHTVSGIAAQVGVPNADKYIDATELTDDESIAKAINENSVFGRVKPEQKKAFMLALQEKGHIVAMTGDGVNDTLALKTSDCSVAMASGSDAARNVAHLVLVDNDFAALPKVVAEGRRSINNLQRSASLFLVKTLLSIVLAILFIILPWQYPFQPIQLTLISAFTIGLPSFVLALEPNKARIKGHFLENVIVHSIPGAICAVLATLIVNIVGYCFLHIDYEHVSTLCVLLTAWVGIQLIVKLSRPFTPIRAALLVVVVGGTVLGATIFHRLFGIMPFTLGMTVLFIILALVTSGLFLVLYKMCDIWHDKRAEAIV